MKVENGMKVFIKDVPIGETFMYQGKLHVKVSCGSLIFSNKDLFNNVILDLEGNELNALKDNMEVQLVHAKIIIN